MCLRVCVSADVCVCPYVCKTVSHHVFMWLQYLAKQFKVDEFVSGEYPLADINKAFDDMHHGKR